MTFDPGSTKGPDVSKVPHVGGARPAAAPAPPPLRAEPRQPAAAPPPPPPLRAEPRQPTAATRSSERQFEHSLAGLSRSLGERAALHPDPVAEAAARRAAVLTQIRAEDRRLKLILGVAGAAVASVCLAAAIVFFAAPFGPRTAAPAATARIQPLIADPSPPAVLAPPPPVQTAAIEPAPPPPAAAPAPVADPPPVTAPPIMAPQVTPPPVSAPSASAAPVSTLSTAPSPTPLARDDVREVQTRLLAFGFNAGPADGNAGSMTEGAIMNYQQKRGLPQTGKPDRALLDQLRDDPAPKVAAQPPSQPPTRAQSQNSYQNAYQNAPPSRAPNTGPTGPQRRGDGLDFIRDADARLSRWFQSLSN